VHRNKIPILIIVLSVLLVSIVCYFFIHYYWIGQSKYEEPKQTPQSQSKQKNSLTNSFILDLKNFKVEPENIPIKYYSSVSFYAEFADNVKIPQKIYLLRRYSDGKIANLGSLYNDGTHGDKMANDTIFSLQTSFNESIAGKIWIVLSTDVNGNTESVIADTLLYATTKEDPDEIRRETASAIRQGRVDSIQSNFSDPVKSLRDVDLSWLADRLESAEVSEKTKNGDSIRYYTSEWVDKSGQKYKYGFWMMKNKSDQWKISE
jgi:hypothetical protein